MSSTTNTMTPENRVALDAEYADVRALSARSRRLLKYAYWLMPMAVLIGFASALAVKFLGVSSEISEVDIPGAIAQAFAPAGSAGGEMTMDSLVSKLYDTLPIFAGIVIATHMLIAGVKFINGETERAVKIIIAAVVICLPLTMMRAALKPEVSKGSTTSRLMNFQNLANKGELAFVRKILKDLDAEPQSLNDYVLAQTAIVKNSGSAPIAPQTREELKNKVRALATAPSDFASPEVMFKLEQSYLGQPESTTAKQFADEYAQHEKLHRIVGGIGWFVCALFLLLGIACWILGSIIDRRVMRILELASEKYL